MRDIPPNITTVIVAILGSTLFMKIAEWIHGGVRKLFGNPKATTDSIMAEVKALSKYTNDNRENIEKLRKEVNNIQLITEENAAKLARTRILRFNNEVIRGIDHTREEWIDCLKSIDEYENYCNTHENFKNGYAVETINHLRTTFQELERDHLL